TRGIRPRLAVISTSTRAWTTTAIDSDARPSAAESVSSASVSGREDCIISGVVQHDPGARHLDPPEKLHRPDQFFAIDASRWRDEQHRPPLVKCRGRRIGYEARKTHDHHTIFRLEATDRRRDIDRPNGLDIPSAE